MDIKKIKSLKNSFNCYQTDEFVTIVIKHQFNYELNKENYIKANILRNYMLKTNEVYKHEKDIIDRGKELYSSVNITNKNIGIKSFLNFELKMVNPRVIEEDYFLDALNYYKDIMLKPNFKDNKLDKEVFNEVKKELIDKEKNNVKDPYIIDVRLYYKNILPESKINDREVTNIKELEDIVSKISEKDIIEFYNEVMEGYVSSYAFGNLTDEEIELIKDSFSFKPIDFDYKYAVKEKIIDKDIEIVSKDTTQSNIYFTYEIKDYSIDNYYLYDTLIYLTNYQNGPVFNIYRTKMGIMYSGNLNIFYNYGLAIIKVYIDKKNKDKAISGLKDIFGILNNKEEVEKLLKYAREKLEALALSNSESFNANILELENYILKYNLPMSEKLIKINQLTVDDIIKQVNNLEYKSTYFYKGDKDEK